jgi:hypothetical protein
MTLDDIVAKVTDPYDRQARLYPALLCLLPLLALIALLYARNGSALTGVVTLAVSCGGLFLMTNICREVGERLEEKLFNEWGGKRFHLPASKPPLFENWADNFSQQSRTQIQRKDTNHLLKS